MESNAQDSSYSEAVSQKLQEVQTQTELIRRTHDLVEKAHRALDDVENTAAQLTIDESQREYVEIYRDAAESVAMYDTDLVWLEAMQSQGIAFDAIQKVWDKVGHERILSDERAAKKPREQAY
jgi:nitrate reductase assembly molybdenum cofactor insertion protein NarJ